ncbi:MAG TPA: AraC family transcriptional regulator [Burkholderiaceae bacterium]|jgi:AraC-like DNA-binding protein
MDPLSQFMALLRPQGFSWKEGEPAGDWALSFPSTPGVAFCLISAGRCRLDLPGQQTVQLQDGDFLLLTAPPAWTLSNGARTTARPFLEAIADPDRFASIRNGSEDGGTRLVGGHFSFDEINAALLKSLIAPVVVIRADTGDAARLHDVLRRISDEAASDRPGRELVLDRLLEIMLVEAIRHSADPLGKVHQGLIAGLYDRQIAIALRAVHADIRIGWSVEKLASVAGLSRSAFAERFARVVGIAPMSYVFHWRMTLAKDALREDNARVEQVAFAVGYSSASAFSTAFNRTVGCPPARYADAQRRTPRHGRKHSSRDEQRGDGRVSA